MSSTIASVIVAERLAEAVSAATGRRLGEQVASFEATRWKT
jgi:hypothetical protein